MSYPQAVYDRVRSERDELSLRLVRLDDFLVSKKFKDLKEPVQELMTEQADAMETYLSILDERLELMEEEGLE
jgi:hypothetical protein